MTSRSYIEDLRRTVEEATPRLLALGDASRTPRAAGKWSPREIVGHLVDSASNNHQRFIRAQFQDDLVFSGYQQDDWVRAGGYQDGRWEDLISLWRTFNLQIARVMELVPDAIRLRDASRHNFDQIGFRALPPGQPATLDYLMEDYVRHLEHHLRQVFDLPQNEARSTKHEERRTRTGNLELGTRTTNINLGPRSPFRLAFRSEFSVPSF